MYLFYLDEAGNTWLDLDNKQQPIHYISWFAVKDTEIKKLDNALKSILPMFLPYSQNYDFEFHGIDMVWWKKYYKKFSIEKRLQALDALIKIYKRHNLTFFSYWLSKAAHKKQYIQPFHPHNVVFKQLIEQIDEFLEEKNEQWILIMDRNDDVGQDIINDFQSYKDKWTWFWSFKRELKHLVDTVYYTESYNSNILQLADVIWYIYASYHTTDALLKWNLKSINYVKKKAFEHVKTIEDQAYYKYIWRKNYPDD